MYTYQDLLKVPDREQERMDFVRNVISRHKASKEYQKAADADSYDKGQNVTIMQYQKLLYTVTGKAVPDNYSANYKLRSKFFNRFVSIRKSLKIGHEFFGFKPCRKCFYPLINLIFNAQKI